MTPPLIHDFDFYNFIHYIHIVDKHNAHIKNLVHNGIVVVCIIHTCIHYQNHLHALWERSRHAIVATSIFVTLFAEEARVLGPSL